MEREKKAISYRDSNPRPLDLSARLLHPLSPQPILDIASNFSRDSLIRTIISFHFVGMSLYRDKNLQQLIGTLYF